MEKLNLGTLSDGKPFLLPRDFITQTQALLGKRRRGKTYTAMVQAEELSKAGLPYVAIDPMGIWWGLRAGKSGTRRGGFDVWVIGGDHADVALNPNSGKALGEFVAGNARPMVVDVSALDSVRAVAFAAEFIDSLYHHNREALHVFVEEADMFAPQSSAIKGDHDSLAAVDRLVRRGGGRGLGTTLISQRPAVLHKNPLSQTEMLACLGFTAPQDVKALQGWFNAHSVEPDRVSEALAALPKLHKGQAYVSSPEWLAFFGLVQIREKETFDTSATPKAGQRREAKSLAPVDLGQLRDAMAEAVREAEANDPRLLRQRVADLQRQLAERPAAAPAEVKTVKERQHVLLADDRKLIKRLTIALEGRNELIKQAVDQIRGLPDHLGADSDDASKLLVRLTDLTRAVAGEQLQGPAAAAAVLHRVAAATPGVRLPVAPRPSSTGIHVDPDNYVDRGRRAPAAPANGDALNPLQVKLLAKLADRGIVPTTMHQMYAMAGASVKSSYYPRLGQALVDRGYAQPVQGGYVITDAGRAVLGADYTPAPASGHDALQHWLRKLPDYEAAVLGAIAQHPHGITAEQISQQTGRSMTSSAFPKALRSLLQLSFIKGDDPYSLGDVFTQ